MPSMTKVCGGNTMNSNDKQLIDFSKYKFKVINIL
jgi:hypothetical protein